MACLFSFLLLVRNPPLPPLNSAACPGVFQGKLLTRGGRTWYKEGVSAPVVERFALRLGHEEVANPIVSALHRLGLVRGT